MEIIIAAAIALILGAGGTFVFVRFLSKKKIQEAEAEAELIKKNKMIEAKEKFIALKAEHEQLVHERNAKLQERENKLQQREMQLNQKQSEVQRKTNEVESQKDHYEQQLATIDARRKELDHMLHQAQQELETISGLSADQAKERLVEALKDEAKTDAMSYINDIMEEAKMTANKEAKKNRHSKHSTCSHRNCNRKFSDRIPH